MIEFKIISTPDKSQQSTYQHVGLELVLGQTEGDMLIDDPGLSARQVRIYWAGSNYMIENLDESVDIRINGKPVKEPSPLKERDNLTMAKTTVNFAKLNRSALTPPEPYEHPQAASRFAAGNKEAAILEALDIMEKQEGGGAMPKPPPLPGGKMPPLPPKKP
jgi:hypothetical protein